MEDISKILNITPPFLLIDNIIEIEPGKYCKSFKKLDNKDWYFKSHLPNLGIMPLSLIIEGMLQNTALCIYLTENHLSNVTFINRIDKLEIKKSVNSFDTDLLYESEIISSKRGIFRFSATCSVKEETVCIANFQFVSPHQLPQILLKND